MRISGIASGFDTDSMVQNLMKIERMKVDRFSQKQQINKWKQEKYNDVNKDLANFVLNSQKNMGIKNSNSYKNLNYTKKVNINTDKISANIIGKVSDADFTMEIEQLAKKDAFVSDDYASNKSKLVNAEKINIAGINLDLKDGDTVDDLVKAINNNDDLKDMGINAFYDRSTKKVFIQGDHNDSLGYSLVIGIEGESINGQHAQVKINGVKMDNIKTNSFEFNGIQFDAKESTGIINVNVGTNTDAVMDKIKGLIEEYNNMVDVVFKAINEPRYNSYHPLSVEEKETMKEKDIELWEEKAKSGMLHKDETLNRMMQNIRIDLFKDVEGLDGAYKNITEIGISTVKYSKGSAGAKLTIDENKLRAAIDKDVDGVMELMFSNEIKGSSSKNKSSKGVFTGVYDNVIDGMKSVINKSGTGENADLFRSVKANMLVDFVSKKGNLSDLDRSIKEGNRKIEDLEKLLIRKEDSYYSKFTAMEKYMYKMNAQSDWLMQQMMF